MGAAALLIPLIPGLVKATMDIIAAARNAEGTPEEVKAQLDAMSAELKLVVARVAAVELPSAST